MYKGYIGRINYTTKLKDCDEERLNIIYNGQIQVKYDCENEKILNVCYRIEGHKYTYSINDELDVTTDELKRIYKLIEEVTNDESLYTECNLCWID